MLYHVLYHKLIIVRSTILSEVAIAVRGIVNVCNCIYSFELFKIIQNYSKKLLVIKNTKINVDGKWLNFRSIDIGSWMSHNKTFQTLSIRWATKGGGHSVGNYSSLTNKSGHDG
jgi:hypothetical protein